jgi:hypothetical protein
VFPVRPRAEYALGVKTKSKKIKIISKKLLGKFEDMRIQLENEPNAATRKAFSPGNRRLQWDTGGCND